MSFQTEYNELACTQTSNARTHSTVLSSMANPAWGDQSSDRLGYDGAGRMITKRFLSGGINGTTHAYNDTTALVGFTTSFDRANNKLYERHIHAEERSHLYQPFNSDGSLASGYDSMDRLLQYQRGVLSSTGGYLGQGGGSILTPIALPNTDVSRVYNLDTLGNWKSTEYTPVGGSDTTELRRHNAVNQITKYASTAVLYDHGNNSGAQGNGNIINDGTRSYEYDALNRLINVYKTPSSPVQIAAYTYDAIGRRIRKVITNGGLPGDIPNATIDYAYDGDQSLEELNGDGETTTVQYVWGQYIDELVKIKTYVDTGSQPLAAGTYYPLQDLLFRTTALTDSSGDIVEAYDTDAYGNTLIFSAAGTGGNWWTDDATQTDLPACQYVFTGRQYDPETGIYWYRRRYYIPVFGRFVSKDPLYYRDGVNCYQSLRSAPEKFTDPTGRNSIQDCFVAFIKPLAKSAHDDFTKAVCDCAKEKKLMPPAGNEMEWRKCMLKKLGNVAADAAAKLACCLLPQWYGSDTDPEKLTKTAVNCQQVCDWKMCLACAADPEKTLLGANFAQQVCYTKCLAEPDWTKW